MKPVNRFYIHDDLDHRVFGEGPYRLIKALEETGSLRAAAITMNMAYSKAMKMLKQAEAAFGFPITSRAIGGRDGGGSLLTDEGRKLMQKYEQYRSMCNDYCMKLYDEIFALPPKIGCIIMASGMGKRFGGNKLIADFGGEALIGRIMSATEGLFARRLVVTRHREIAELCNAQDQEVVLHDFPLRSDAVRIGIERMEDMDGCIFCPGDQPLLRRESLRALMDSFVAEPNCMHRLAYGERCGAPVIFPRSLFDELRNLPEGRGGNALPERYPDRVRCVQAGSEAELADIDTPEDLLRLLQML